MFSKKKIIEESRKVILVCIVVLSSILLFSCKKLPYTKEEILCEYEDFNSLYYVKNQYDEHKYSDYIIDDVSNGEYKVSTPSITDFKNGDGALDYDIAAYVEARTDFILKKELIDKYEIAVDEICAKVRDDYFRERKAYVYYYDKTDGKNTLLYDGLVSNLSYDDEIPTISFDIDNGAEAIDEEFSGRKIKLSDIIAANSTIDGFMRVLLGSNKVRYKFFMNNRIDNDEFYMATKSEIGG